MTADPAPIGATDLLLDLLCWMEVPSRKIQGAQEAPRVAIPHHVRVGVYARDGRACHWASNVVPCDDVLHLDHMLPLSVGGSNRSDNLRVLCQMHNLRRGTSADPTDGRAVLPITWACRACDTCCDTEGWETLAFCALCGQDDYTSRKLIDIGRDWWCKRTGCWPHDEAWIADLGR